MGLMGFGLGMGLWGLLVMLAFWLLLIGGAIWLVRLLFRAVPESKQHPETDSADDIIKIRYARGELTEEQYRAMQQTLRQ